MPMAVLFTEYEISGTFVHSKTDHLGRIIALCVTPLARLHIQSSSKNYIIYSPWTSYVTASQMKHSTTQHEFSCITHHTRDIMTWAVTTSSNSQWVTYGSDDRNTSNASDVGIHSWTLPLLTVNSNQVLIPKWARTRWQTIDRLA